MINKRWRATFDRRDRNESFTVNQHSGDLDEMCIGEWLHAERMDRSSWFVSVGPHCFWLKERRDGTAEITMREDRAVVTPKQRAANRRRVGLPPEPRPIAPPAAEDAK